MKWILLVLGFVMLFFICILHVVKLKKLYKVEQDDFENANHLSVEKQTEKTKKK